MPVFESAPFTVAAPATPAASGILSGVPSTATAGSLLVGTGAGSTITYTASNVTTPYAALVTGAAVVVQAVRHRPLQIGCDDRGSGHTYAVDLVNVSNHATVLWESATVNVTAAPGALPAQVGPFSIASAGAGSATLSWPAAAGATGYRSWRGAALAAADGARSRTASSAPR